MSTINGCYSNIRAYESLKSKVNIIISYLDTYDEVEDKLLL